MNLIELAEAGDAGGVLRELRALTPEARASHAAALAARAEAMADGQHAYTDEQRLAQYVAQLGCAGPEVVASWLLRNPLRPTTPGAHPDYNKYPTYRLMVEITDLYPPDWRAELVAQLAALSSLRDSWRDWFSVAEHVIRSTGCPVPTTDSFVNAWLDDRRRPNSLAEPPGGTLLERLRRDDLAPQLLPLALTRPGVPLDTGFFRKGDSRTGAFIALSIEGALDRGALIRRIFAELASDPMDYWLRWPDLADAVTALALTPEEHASVASERVWLVERLLKAIIDDWRGKQAKPSLAYLRALAPTAAENARFAKEHLTLLDRQPGAAARYAQEVLLALDQAGLLDAAMFTKVNDRVLSNPGLRAYRVAGFVSRLAAGRAIDRGTLIPRVFADLAVDAPYRGQAADVVTALALTPEEHAGVATERVRIIEPVLASLLQEDRRKVIADSVAFLRALAPAAAENALFLRDHVAMLDLPLPVAAYGQQALIALDEAGLLEDDVRTEASERILLRPDKKLVRAQLAWLDRVARREPGDAGQILVDAAIAFQHGDMTLQESALKVVARHLQAAGNSVLPELRDAAGRLSPGLSAQAAELFGPPHGGTAEEFAEVLPAVPGPRPVPAPIETAAEVAQEVAVVLANPQDVVAFERALDGLVRHARLDRAALAAALAPVLRRPPAHTGDYTQAGLYDVTAAAAGREPRKWHDEPGHHLPGFPPAATPPGAMLQARLAEAIEVIRSGTQPFLLAVPTLATGALDAAALVKRVTELDRLGVTPAPADLAQALLRVTPTTDQSVHAAAGELRSDAGQRLAQWLRQGGLPHQDSTPEGWPVSDPASAPAGRWYPASPGPDHAPPLPQVAAALVGPHKQPEMTAGSTAPFWAAQLPHHRDEVAARIWRVGSGRMLTCLAESGGPAGYAVHWHIARCLEFDRDAAVDALLVLAAQGQLDSRLFAGQLQALMRGKMSTPERVVGALRAAAETGAYATVWSVLKAALPALLGDKPVRGAGALLALAVECAAKCGAKGQIAEVEAVANRTGPSQTVKNARLLRDVLR